MIRPLQSPPRAHLAGILAALVAALALLAAAGCREAPPGRTSTTSGAPAQPPVEAKGSRLTVWADPVLVRALEGLAADYRKASRGGDYAVVPVERGQLASWAGGAEQPDLPAPDVLLFGGHGDDYIALVAGQRIDEGAARTFAGDRLVVVKPEGSTFVSKTVFDLFESRFKELQIGDPETTYVGMLGRQAIVSDGLEPRVSDRLVTVPGSMQVPEGPAQNGSVLAVCFISQTGAASGIEPMLLIDNDLHEEVLYKAAPAFGRGSDPAVIAFLRWLAEDSATQAALGGYGLISREAALAQQQAVRDGGPPQPPGVPITSDSAGQDTDASGGDSTAEPGAG